MQSECKDNVFFLKNQTMKIKNLIFDMGGVLIDLDQHKCMDNFKKLGFKNIADYIDPYTQQGFFADFETGNISVQEFYTIVKSKCRNNITDEDIANALNSFLLEIPQKKLDAILKLREQFKIFLLSNTNAIHFPWISQKYEFDKYFDKCYTSYTLHYVKPDPRIFIHVLKDAGIQASETLFIDDSPVNIAAASNLGFLTHLAKEKEDFTQLFLNLQPL